jgi:hypothetical protein
MVRPADQAGIVRGAIKKNRNGPPNLDIAFRIGSRTVGEDVDGDAITAPICEPCDPLNGEAPVALSGAESAALGLLTDMADAEGRVDEATWREAAIGGVAVSASDDRANRRKAVNRAIQGLARKGLITTGEGSFQIVSRAIAPVEFDDEESDDDLV